MTITIDLDDLAGQLVDDLRISDAGIKDAGDNGYFFPSWSNTLVDILEKTYGLETELREIIIGWQDDTYSIKRG